MTTKAAAVDAGTNTILFLAGDDAGRTLADEIEFARLGEGVDQSGRLSDAAIARGLSAFRRYASQCIDLGIANVRVTGTSALRDAANGADFVAAVKRETGWTLEIIGGEREAALGFAAATDELPDGAPALVIDIGGGSMQLIRGRARRGLEHSISLQLGSVRMTERFFRHDPPTDDEIARLAAHVDAELERAPATAGDVPVYGVAGTCTTLAAVSLRLAEYDAARVHGSSLPLREIERLLAAFRATDSAGRARMPGLHPKRADVIVAGTVTALRTLARYRQDALLVRDRGIRHAVLREALRASR